MNLFVIVGRLGKDAVLRYTSNGKPVLSFRVAVSSGWGEHKRTTWVSCSIWGDRAVKLDQKKCFTKGLLLSLRGEASASVFENESGKTASLECRVNDFEFLSSSKNNTEESSLESPSIDANSNELDDLPF